MDSIIINYYKFFIGDDRCFIGCYITHNRKPNAWFLTFLPTENHLSVTLFNKVKETARQHVEGEYNSCKHCFKILMIM